MRESVEKQMAAEPTDYSIDRHTALHLVNTGQIISNDAIPRRTDGADLDPGVFAALLRLGRAGYLEMRMPKSEAVAEGSDQPVRLTVAGLQMLSRFRQAHGRCPQPSGVTRPSIANTVPRA